MFMKIESKYYFYQNDHLGTPQKMTAVNGAVVWSAKYSSFGEAEVEPTSTVENHLRFPGQYFDGETGLHYNWHRYYDPDAGRYLTPDPIGLTGGINPFVYSYNHPVNYTDPYGLFRWHGNWGGPDWTAGHKKSWNEFTPAEKAKIFEAIENQDVENGAPRDLQDVQYMYHDFAYGTCRDNCATATCPTECEKNCFNRADFELAERLAKLAIEKPHWLKLWLTAPLFILQPGFRNGGYDKDGTHYQFRWDFD